MDGFEERLRENIMKSLFNDYQLHKDNWFLHEDYFIREKKNPNNFKDRIIKRRLSKYYSPNYVIDNVLSTLLEKRNDISFYNYLYDHLNDEYSKSILIDLVSLRILGAKYIRLTIENEQYLNYHKDALSSIIPSETILLKTSNIKLQKYEFSFEKQRIKCFLDTMGVVSIFKAEQYCYNPKKIQVKDGDVVIDGGGCWGDTALYFANKAKETTVYTFEFTPSNIKVMEKNIALNNAKNIRIIPKAIFDVSNEEYFLVDKGASSFFTKEKTTDAIQIQTITIDDFTKQENVSKINFIKLDIEGAELNALKGSVETIKKWRPTLAIAVYHNPIDFKELVQFISELNLGYKFYLDHFTPSIAETIVFATIED